jgi:hypothetical protein
MVDMLNLVYSETQDEDVYRAISRRMKDCWEICSRVLLRRDVGEWLLRPR